MKVRVEVRGMEQSDPLREYAISEATNLQKFFDGIISVEITMEVEKERRNAQIFAHLIKKKTVKASAQSDDMYVSVDKAMDKVKRQLKKYNEMLKSKDKGEAPMASAEGLGQTDDSQNDGEIVQTDMYFKKPMSPEEAVLQLESYEKSFLVFINSQSDKLNIVYHRGDGDYGLIDPQI